MVVCELSYQSYQGYITPNTGNFREKLCLFQSRISDGKGEYFTKQIALLK